MDENKLKTIVEEAINKAVDPIKEDINGIKGDIDGIKEDLSGVKKDLNEVKEDLSGVKKDLNEVKEDLSGVKKDLNEVKEDLSGVKGDIDGIKGTLKDHTRKFEALSGDTEQLLDDVKGIRDEIGLWHQRDKREIDEIKKHLGLPLMSDIPNV